MSGTLVQLLNIPTDDGIALPAGFWDAPGAAGVDAVMVSVGPFHQPFTTGLVEAFVAAGYPTLAVSNRGCVVAMHFPGRPTLLGTAFERVSDCVHDYGAGVRWLRERGYQRIAVFSHSIAATKALYYAAHDPDPAVAGVIASAAIRVSAGHYARSEHGAAFAENLATARALVNAGRPEDTFNVTFPLGPLPMTAAAYLDKYGDEKYDVRTWAHQIQAPVLAVYPEGDLVPGSYYGVHGIGMAEDLFRLAPPNPRHRSVVIPNRDHVYSAGQGPLVEVVLEWLGAANSAA